RHGRSIQRARNLGTIVKSDYRNMHVRAIKDPIAITPRHENIASLLYSLQDPAIGTAADALRGEQPRAPDFSLRNESAGFLKPIADVICFTGHSAIICVE